MVRHSTVLCDFNIMKIITMFTARLRDIVRIRLFLWHNVVNIYDVLRSAYLLFLFLNISVYIIFLSARTTCVSLSGVSSVRFPPVCVRWTPRAWPACYKTYRRQFLTILLGYYYSKDCSRQLTQIYYSYTRTYNLKFKSPQNKSSPSIIVKSKIWRFGKSVLLYTFYKY